MAIEFKDYYKILGISRSADFDEIRRAFRKKARLYHPDVTGNDLRAENKFKELNEAYEVLGDPGRRQRYDEFTLQWPPGSNFQDIPGWDQFGETRSGMNGGRSQHFTFTGAGFSEFFDQLFGPQGKQAFEQSTRPLRSEVRDDGDGRGDDLESDLWVTLEEVGTGTVRPITMKRAVRCKTCYGVGQYNAHSCEACAGSGSILRTDTFKVKVPVGIAEGACLRVQGQGEEGFQGGEPGDLYLRIRYTSHPEFHIEKGQLTYLLEVTPWEAVLGANVSVPTLDGRVSIKVPAGSQSGTKLRLRGRGLPARDGSAGDLVVTLKLQVPTATRDRERVLWEELARESTFHPREN